MTQKEIHASLDKMLENPKAKNFLNHLVRAYLPITNVVTVMDKPEKDFKCVLTREPVVSVRCIYDAMNTEEVKNDFMNQLKTIFDEDTSKNPAVKIIGEKKLGVTGKETTTYMSYLAYQEFYNWVITKSLTGNKHINWLLGSIRRATFIERAETIQDDGLQEKLKDYKTKNGGGATFTLGDACAAAIAKLKAEFDTEAQN